MVNKKIDSFFKKSGSQDIEVNATTKPSTNNVEASIPEQRPCKVPRIESKEVYTSSLVRDPGLRPQIWDYLISQCDEIQRAYTKFGSYQPNNHPFEEKNGHRFLASWNKLFPDWLEYSPTKHCAFCLPCYLFTKPNGRTTSSAFISDEFSSWKKVNSEKNCAFLTHMGKGPNSSHKIAVKSCHDLTNQAQHIEKIVEKQTSQQVAKNRLRLKTTIYVVKWLTFQACAFRGRDEGHDSNNRGNVIELINILASYNADVADVVLHKAPQNALYYSHKIQKEILSIFFDKIQRFIREEIDEAKFYVIVDEARDESKREQMAIVLRFVDKDGFIKEHFFDIVHVSDTTSATLKEEICIVLSRHNLSVQNIRGQGYDGASNMRGEWTGLQALFLHDCHFAYYVHCFAHRLQLALVATTREVIPVAQFFSYLAFIVNLCGSSCKRHDQLKVAQAKEIAAKLAIDEVETGKGKNQVGTLKRAGDTRWGSHLGSISCLINMFGATCSVLSNVINDGATSTQHADADGVYDKITSFESVCYLTSYERYYGDY
ncbi:zinc finger MYM-type protein 1-like [Camellia sinensis]|uniref:zinc finger MYM-type protein 1-like n=1 Tax=Camellia sinensis TaxID=4442 RepID=UPI0010367E6F|nr:zinc finger MYM-type protein 1-like [Camellia sinensis]